MDVIELIKRDCKMGTKIPKPKAKREFEVKGWRIRRGQPALIYLVPNNKNPEKPYEKGITISEWKQAFEQLMKKGEFSSEWFKQNMADCAAEGWCNFTTIGGIFKLLGFARYERRGLYVKKRS